MEFIDLDPLNIDEKSLKISNLVGGNENLFELIEQVTKRASVYFRAIKHVN